MTDNPPPAGDNRPIGVFDSGIGGLTVAAALAHRLPNEALLYLGDTARLPYGTKGPDTVRRYALNAVQFLVDQGIKMLVVACNTASAHALEALRTAHPDLPILGVVDAGARAAVQASSSGRIAVAATEGTCASQAFIRAIHAYRPDAHVEQIPCPLFVALAEEGIADHPIADETVRFYLTPTFSVAEPPDTLVLGCTHFPLLIPSLRRSLPLPPHAPPHAMPQLVDCAHAVAEDAAHTLARRRRTATRSAPATPQFLVTDGPQRFCRVARHFFPPSQSPLTVQRVDLF